MSEPEPLSGEPITPPFAAPAPDPEPLGGDEPITPAFAPPAPEPAISDAVANPPEPKGAPGAELDVEIVDGLPVLAEVRTVERASPAALPAVQVAAVAATGFVAGAATVVLVKRLSGRKLSRSARSGPRRPADLLPITASRSFLVDVHVIAKPE